MAYAKLLHDTHITTLRELLADSCEQEAVLRHSMEQAKKAVKKPRKK